MNTTFYWIAWCLTSLFCGWIILRAIVQPHRLLEWPFMTAAIWTYFYVYMSLDVTQEFPGVVSNTGLFLGQLLPLLSFICLLIGWQKAKPKTSINFRSYDSIDNNILIWAIGLMLIIVGAVGGYLVQGVSNNQYQLNVESTSAYYYLLFYVGYPGMALALWVAAQVTDYRRKYFILITFIAICVFLYPHVSSLRRGPTFPAVILVLIVSSLARKRSPNVLLYVSGFVGIGLLMLVFLQLRNVLYNEGTWSEAMSSLKISDAVTERSKAIYDNEFINNCHMIDALSSNGKYQYGTGHLSLLVHWVPRSVWNGKGVLGEGSYSFDELFSDVGNHSGLQLLGGGAAAGGVADAFVQYGYLSPLFWLFLGWVASKAYWKGVRDGNILWIHGYLGFVCSTHWLISQGLAAAFVPMLAFISIPILVLKIFGNLKPKSLATPFSASSELDHKS